MRRFSYSLVFGLLSLFIAGCQPSTTASAVAMTNSQLVQDAVKAAQNGTKIKDPEQQKQLQDDMAAQNIAPEPGMGVAFFKNKEPDGQDITVALVYTFDEAGKVRVIRSYMTAGSGIWKVLAPAAAIALADVIEEPLVRVPKNNTSVNVAGSSARSGSTSGADANADQSVSLP